MGVYTPSNLADARVAAESVFGEAYAGQAAHRKPRLSWERKAPRGRRGIAGHGRRTSDPAELCADPPHAARRGARHAAYFPYYTGVQGPTASAATTCATIPTAAAEGIDAVAPGERAAAVCPSATPQYPQRQARLDELDDLLRGHDGCWPYTHTRARMRVRVRPAVGVQGADDGERKSE
ncbi:hypothetical_protein-conserved [Leishmania major strain Friedlin]|nr:hypothetical_protein-conserved [Leishmania major strain Friedlin]